MEWWSSGVLDKATLHCSITPSLRAARALVARAALLTKKNKHRCPQPSAERTRWNRFTAVLSVFQAHLPMHDL